MKWLVVFPIIILLLLLSGCTQEGTLRYVTSDNSPISISATFSEKPTPGKTVSIDFEFVSSYEDKDMPVEITLSDSISLVGGTVKDNLVVSDKNAHKTISIKINEAGYHRITVKAEAISMGFTRVDTFYLEVTETNAILYSKCPVDKIGIENCY